MLRSRHRCGLMRCSQSKLMSLEHALHRTGHTEVVEQPLVAVSSTVDECVATRALWMVIARSIRATMLAVCLAERGPRIRLDLRVPRVVIELHRCPCAGAKARVGSSYNAVQHSGAVQMVWSFDIASGPDSPMQGQDTKALHPYQEKLVLGLLPMLYM